MDIIDDVLDLKDSLEDVLEAGRRRLRRPLRGQSGFSTLVTVLVIMAVGALIITPLLALVVTGQRAGNTHNAIKDRLYAADTGIQDGMWRVLNDEVSVELLGTWGNDTYDYAQTYTLAQPVNGCDVTVTIRAIWLLQGLETAKNGRQPHGSLVTVGNSMSAGHYKIVVMDNGITGEYKLERIAVWLPAGFTYVEGSSNVENLDPTHPAYIQSSNVLVSDWKNGHTVIWDYDAQGKVNYSDLPAETSTRRVITFDFSGGSSMTNAFSWCRTNRNDIYLSWTGDLKQFQLEATAYDPETDKSTTVIAENMKNEGVSSGMAINGDYVATGNALIRDQNDDTFKERLYYETPAALSGIPDSGAARRILLYWTGWKAYPLNAWKENKADWTSWTSAHREELLNLVPNYHVDQVSLTVKIGVSEYSLSSVQADSWQVVPGTKVDDSADPYQPWTSGNGWFYSCSADVTDEVKNLLLANLTSAEYAAFNGEATYIVGHAETSSAVELDRVMQGVWGSSATDVYVVGDSGTIVHFDGSSWGTVASGATSRNLKSVWGSSGNDIWAVGDSRSVGGRSYYTILHSPDAGVTWNDLSVASGHNLKSIWGSSNQNIWAVGDAYRSSSTDYYTILRTTNGGTTWTNTSSVSGFGAKTLYGVWGASENCVFAVGADGRIVRYAGGASWGGMSSGSFNTLRGVWGTGNDWAGGDRVWAVGNSGTILVYNGSSWSSPYSKPFGSSDVTLCGVWGTGGTTSSDRVYAVGYRGGGSSQGVVWYYDFDGNQWHEMDSGTSKRLSGIWGSAANNIYAAGEGTTTAGTLLYYDTVDDDRDGSLWDPVNGGTGMYSYNASNHASEVILAGTDYPLGDAGSTYGNSPPGPNYQVGHAAWSILVVYTSPETKGHQLYFFDTLQPSGRYVTTDIDIDGFLAPESVATEDDAARITCFVGEGDEKVWYDEDWVLDGDNIYLNGHRLNKDVEGNPSPVNDVWNARSTEMDADGIDIDTFYISGASGCIDPGDSQATVTFQTEEDRWNMVYMILSMRSDLSATGVLTYIVK